MHRNNTTNASEETPVTSGEAQEDLAGGGPAEPVTTSGPATPATAVADRDAAMTAADRDAADRDTAVVATETGPDHVARVAETGYGRTGMMRIARTRGMLAGLLLMALGAWGAIVPFIGPYFGYGLGTAGPWYFTLGRLWLDVLPGAAVFFGGLVLAFSRNRAVAWSAAWLALAGGVWFVVGSQISRLWTADGTTAAGTVTGFTGHQVAQYMGYFFGLGAVICVVAALAAGRLAVRSIFDVRADLARRSKLTHRAA